MTTMPRVSSQAQSRGGFCIFLGRSLLSMRHRGHVSSWGQESVLDRGPAPESVDELNSPLDIPFLPLAPIPWAFTTLRDSLRESRKPLMGNPAAFLPRYPIGSEFPPVLFLPR